MSVLSEKDTLSMPATVDSTIRLAFDIGNWSKSQLHFLTHTRAIQFEGYLTQIHINETPSSYPFLSTVLLMSHTIHPYNHVGLNLSTNLCCLPYRTTACNTLSRFHIASHCTLFYLSDSYIQIFVSMVVWFLSYSISV